MPVRKVSNTERHLHLLNLIKGLHNKSMSCHVNMSPTTIVCRTPNNRRGSK